MGPDKKKIEALEKKMAQLGIQHTDIEEKFIKGSGRGGQKINKTSSAVFLRHRTTGLSVKCAKARSQHLNRFLALRQLVEKIELMNSGTPTASVLKAKKVRKQKAKRKKRTRLKHLPDE